VEVQLAFIVAAKKLKNTNQSHFASIIVIYMAWKYVDKEYSVNETAKKHSIHKCHAEMY
jgi:hypothetical protein